MATAATWNPEADQRLRNHVERHGLKCWAELAKNVNNGCNARQVRERWVYQLDPSINHGPWSPEEDARMEELFIKSGGSWAVMALSLPGRTDMQIKNRWTVTTNKFFSKPALAAPLHEMQASELFDLFESTSAENPASPPANVGKKRMVTAVAPRPAPIKRARATPSPCTDQSMTKVTFGGFGHLSSSTFASLNASLAGPKSKIADARAQKWDGLGKL